MTEKEMMQREMLYCAVDEELQSEMARGRKLLRLFNTATEEQIPYRTELLKELLNKTGEHVYIEPPFRCDYGSNIEVGENFYANYDCIMLDVCEIKIGANVMFGPRVSIYTAAHPIDADIRISGLEFGKKVSIGDNTWIGGSAVINPGVTIGKNVVIGAGSVVTKDIPDNVIAVGNPCRVLRNITEDDKAYWEEERKKYYARKITE